MAAEKKYGPGVTDTEIKIGQTMPYSGPISSLSRFGRIETAYLKMINAAGGINGRKVTLRFARRCFHAGKDGAADAEARGGRRCAGDRRIDRHPDQPLCREISQQQGRFHKSCCSASTPKLDDPENLPWTTTFMMPQPVETRIYAEYLLKTKPDAKIAVIYQNDDLGKGNLSGFKAALGSRASTMVVGRGRLRHHGADGRFPNSGTQGLRCRYVVSCLQRTLSPRKPSARRTS